MIRGQSSWPVAGGGGEFNGWRGEKKKMLKDKSMYKTSKRMLEIIKKGHSGSQSDTGQDEKKNNRKNVDNK